MRCMVCGSEIPDGSPFCNVCNATMPQSAKIPVIPNRRMGAVQADGTANSPRPKDDKTKASGGGTNKALLITLIVLLAVCVIGLGVGTVFFVKQVKKADQLTDDFVFALDYLGVVE